MSTIWDLIGGLDVKIRALEEKKEKLIREFQEACLHPLHAVVGSRWGSPEFRVCRLCGYAEEGRCGYWKLAPGKTSSIPALDDAAAREYVLTRLTPTEVVNGKRGRKKGAHE